MYLYTEDSIKDDLSYYPCPFVINTYNYYTGREETFTEWRNLILPIIRDPVAAAYGIDPSVIDTLKFTEIQTMCDELVSEAFEGAPSRYDFT